MSRLIAPGVIRSENRFLVAVSIPELFPLLLTVLAQGGPASPAALGLKADRFVDMLAGLLYAGAERWRLVWFKDVTLIFEVPPEFSDAELVSKLDEIKKDLVTSN